MSAAARRPTSPVSRNDWPSAAVRNSSGEDRRRDSESRAAASAAAPSRGAASDAPEWPCAEACACPFSRAKWEKRSVAAAGRPEASGGMLAVAERRVRRVSALEASGMAGFSTDWAGGSPGEWEGRVLAPSPRPPRGRRDDAGASTTRPPPSPERIGRIAGTRVSPPASEGEDRPAAAAPAPPAGVKARTAALAFAPAGEPAALPSGRACWAAALSGPRASAREISAAA